jgi:hypothetical protein
VLHGPMPSKQCPQSKYVQGRHAFTTPVRGLDTSSVTTNAAMQIVKVAQLLPLIDAGEVYLTAPKGSKANIGSNSTLRTTSFWGLIAACDDLPNL